MDLTNIRRVSNRLRMEYAEQVTGIPIETLVKGRADDRRRRMVSAFAGRWELPSITSAPIPPRPSQICCC